MVIIERAGEEGAVERVVARVAVAPGVVQEALGVVAAQVPAQFLPSDMDGLAVQEDLAPVGRGVGAQALLTQGRPLPQDRREPCAEAPQDGILPDADI